MKVIFTRTSTYGEEDSWKSSNGYEIFFDDSDPETYGNCKFFVYKNDELLNEFETLKEAKDFCKGIKKPIIYIATDGCGGVAYLENKNGKNWLISYIEDSKMKNVEFSEKQRAIDFLENKGLKI